MEIEGEFSSKFFSDVFLDEFSLSIFFSKFHKQPLTSFSRGLVFVVSGGVSSSKTCISILFIILFGIE